MEEELEANLRRVDDITSKLGLLNDSGIEDVLEQEPRDTTDVSTDKKKFKMIGVSVEFHQELSAKKGRQTFEEFIKSLMYR